MADDTERPSLGLDADDGAVDADRGSLGSVGDSGSRIAADLFASGNGSDAVRRGARMAVPVVPAPGDFEYVGAAPLGPGDDHPLSPSVEMANASQPLGPGDDDPRSPVNGNPESARPPLGPGASAGENPDDAFDFLAPKAAGPGDASSGARHVVRIAKRQE